MKEYKRLTDKDWKDWIEDDFYTSAYNLDYKEVDKLICRLAELEDKIENGTLVELPCIIVGNGSLDAFGKVRVPYYQVLRLDKFGMLKKWQTTDKAEAEAKLKELQNER